MRGVGYRYAPRQRRRSHRKLIPVSNLSHPGFRSVLPTGGHGRIARSARSRRSLRRPVRAAPGPAAAAKAKRPLAGGVVHACLKFKGKAATRGSLRVVRSARACKRKRGERAIAWSVSGPGGGRQRGAAGTRSPGTRQGEAPGRPARRTGPARRDRPDRANRPGGRDSQTLVETIQTSRQTIDALTDQVGELEPGTARRQGHASAPSRPPSATSRTRSAASRARSAPSPPRSAASRATSPTPARSSRRSPAGSNWLASSIGEIALTGVTGLLVGLGLSLPTLPIGCPPSTARPRLPEPGGGPPALLLARGDAEDRDDLGLVRLGVDDVGAGAAAEPAGGFVVADEDARVVLAVGVLDPDLVALLEPSRSPRSSAPVYSRAAALGRLSRRPSRRSSRR